MSDLSFFLVQCTCYTIGHYYVPYGPDPSVYSCSDACEGLFHSVDVFIDFFFRRVDLLLVPYLDVIADDLKNVCLLYGGWLFLLAFKSKQPSTMKGNPDVGRSISVVYHYREYVTIQKQGGRKKAYIDPLVIKTDPLRFDAMEISLGALTFNTHTII